MTTPSGHQQAPNPNPLQATATPSLQAAGPPPSPPLPPFPQLQLSPPPPSHFLQPLLPSKYLPSASAPSGSQTQQTQGSSSTAADHPLSMYSTCRGRGQLPFNHVRVTRHTSHITRHTSHVTRHTSHIARHTSHVTRHTSHITRHTSHVTRPFVSFQPLGPVSCPSSRLIPAPSLRCGIRVDAVWCMVHGVVCMAYALGFRV